MWAAGGRSAQLGHTGLVDVLVVGGGQSGLAVGYHLRRLRSTAKAVTGAARPAPSFVILDQRPGPGGAWLDGWESLRLFSPAAYSSLPGWPMPAWAEDDDLPPARHVAAYLAAYEQRYSLPVERPVHVERVTDDSRDDRRLTVHTDRGRWAARAVVSTTGTWARPFWPRLPGMEDFAGSQMHAADYRGPDDFSGQRVLVVGGGNSAAQIAADLQKTSDVTWAARRQPRYLPDDVDGRALFDIATRAVRDRAQGEPGDGGGVASLGDVVAVPSVRRARDEFGLRAVDLPVRLTAGGAVWADGRAQPFDAVVWCTGFRPALRHLDPLRLHRTQGRPVTSTDGDRYPVQAADDPRVLLVGYGDWCGPASATLIGVNRAARDAASDIRDLLGFALR